MNILVIQFINTVVNPRADGEGTNSPRLFTPGETKALAKSKSSSNIAGVGHQPWVVILTDLKNMADCHE
jgi:hypothetical protein